MVQLKLVGMEGFEPPTNPRCKRGALNQLSYIPNGQNGRTPAIPSVSVLRARYFNSITS